MRQKGENAQILKRGWTTGACATAATKSALHALLKGEFLDPVSIILPKGEIPAFPLAFEKRTDDTASATIIKDAGDDPDVTHGAKIWASVRILAKGSGIVFKAGKGVGTVTKAGLPIGVGEPAINPVPRAMMTQEVMALCDANHISADIEIIIGVEDGEALATKTWNPRLGIVGGLSILGTTGIVHPFSCAAWIHSIHRGVDVSRAAGLGRIIGATGSSSEGAAQAIYQLPEIGLIDMGDFAGGLLKYLRAHPIPNLTIAGGFAKLTKLAQGALDLHSGRSQVDMEFLLSCAEAQLNQFGKTLNQDMKQQILNANTALEVLEMTQAIGIDLPTEIALRAQKSAINALRGAPVAIEVIVCDRKGKVLARHA